jgi:hypothetical protein
MTIPDYSWPKEEAIVLKALWEGGADAAMQQRVIKHIIEMLGGINQVGLAPGQPDITAFNAGRQWVARQLQNAITIPLDKLAREEPDESRPTGIITNTERATRTYLDHVNRTRTSTRR